MASPRTTADLLELVRKSGVIDANRLGRLLAAPPALPDDPKDAAKRLVKDGALTQFQAAQLLQGRYRGFFITDQYKVLEQLGKGGMGAVFLCEHVALRRKVAVKVLPGASAENPAMLERFFREARAVAALDHPNIVRIFDVNKAGALHFLVMEHMEGADLHAVLRDRGQLPFEEAVGYIAQAARGLQHAHEKGLVHRDIKPANLIVDPHGVLKILDMGLARFFEDKADDLTQRLDNGAVLGTADYLSPEQAMNSSTVDIRADIYSLGATFFTLLTGHPPFRGSLATKLLAHQTVEAESIHFMRPDVSLSLAAVVAKMLAKDPADRFQVPREVAEALAPWEPEEASALAAPGSTRRMSPAVGALSGQHSSVGGPRSSSRAAGSSTKITALSSRKMQAVVSDGVTEAAGPRGRQPAFVWVGIGSAVVLVTLSVTAIWLAVDRRGRHGETPPVADAASTTNDVDGGTGDPPVIPRTTSTAPVAPLVGEVRRLDNPFAERFDDVAVSADGGRAFGVTAGGQMRGWNVSTGALLFGPAPIPVGSFTSGADIGTPAIKGSWSFDRATGAYLLKAGGADIWGDTDGGYLVSRRVTGNFTLTARVSGVQDVNEWAKGGLMAREGTAANARSVAFLLSARHGTQIMIRPQAGVKAEGPFGTQGQIPAVWLRLVRNGTTFTCYQAPARDKERPADADWRLIGGRATVQAPDTLDVGFALTSHDEAKQTEALFSDVSAVPFAIEGEGLGWAVTALRADGKQLVVGAGLNAGPDGANVPTVLVDPATGAEQARFPGHPNGTTAVGYAPDGKTALTAGADRLVRLWDVTAAVPKATATLPGFPGAIRCATFSADGSVVAAGGDGGGPEGVIVLWNVAAAKETARFSAYGGNVDGLSFAADGTTLAAASADGSVRLWDLVNGRELRRLAAHRGAARAVKFLPDGRRLLSAGGPNARDGEQTLKLWDVETGDEVGLLTGPRGPITGLSLTRDGHVALTTGRDAVVRVWDLRPREAVGGAGEKSGGKESK